MITNEELERAFDPSDVDAAQRLAYYSRDILQICQRILNETHAGLRIGRDTSTELAVKMRDIGNTLGFYELVESNQFHEKLTAK